MKKIKVSNSIYGKGWSYAEFQSVKERSYKISEIRKRNCVWINILISFPNRDY